GAPHNALGEPGIRARRPGRSPLGIRPGLKSYRAASPGLALRTQEGIMGTKVGVIGSGTVGQVLASGFKKHGYDVMIGSRDASKVMAWAEGAGVAVGDFAQTAAHGEIVVLAVLGRIAGQALQLAGFANL